MRDRTAFVCTAILAATMVLCTWYLGVVIKVAADEISSDDSDNSDQVQQTVDAVDPRRPRTDVVSWLSRPAAAHLWRHHRPVGSVNGVMAIR